MNHKIGIPELRFLGFSEKWKEKRLGEIAKITTGSTPSTLIEEYYNGEKLFVSPADIQENRYVFKTKTTLTESGFGKGRKIAKGSVLFVCIGSTIGKIAQATEECLTNQQINALNANKEYANDFIYELLEKNGTKIKLLAGVQAVPQINKTDFSNFKYFLPTLPEQKKIASFLSAVDEKIQQLSRKKELLEQYKKGVMQQLFSGKLRFKDEQGNDYADWEEKTFGAVARFVNGKAYKQVELLSEGKYRVLRVGNLFSNNEWYYSDLELDKDKYIEKGDLIYAWSASFGPRFWEQEKIIYHYHIWKVVPNENVDKLFLFHTFMFDVEKLKTQSQGGTMFHITKGNIETRLFNFPCLEEQQKIADFLSSIDTRIESTNQQITQTQSFKKGLLQQMFV
jgi:type I restriction enzyme S subunit